jgi:hypothetical protein
MGRASSNKKVARIASTGGGRTARGRTPWLWYGGLAIVVVLGTLLVVSSRKGLNPTVPHPDFNDHWHMAYGIYICNEFKPPMPQPSKLLGLHTHTDGLIHVEPNVTGSVLDTGSNANVGRFASGQPGFKITQTSIQYPGDRLYKNGDKCGSKKATLQVRVWADKTADKPETITGDPHKIKVEDQALVTFAFVPDGQSIPKPPSASNLANPNANEGKAPTSTEPSTPTTVASSSDTTAPPTSAPAPSTTAAP